MKTTYRFVFVALMISLATSGFSQGTNTTTGETEKKDQDDPALEKSGRAAGLRKLTDNAHRDWNQDIDIDEEALEAQVELAVEHAMKSVEATLENLDVQLYQIAVNIPELNINIEPIEVNIPEPNIDIESIEINIPEINVNIDPIELNEEDFGTDVDEVRDWNDESNDEENSDDDSDNDEMILNNDTSSISNDKVKEKNKSEKKDKQKSKSRKNEKDKSKGLKKIK